MMEGPLRSHFELTRSNEQNLRKVDKPQVISRKAEDNTGLTEEDAERQVYCKQSPSAASGSGEPAARPTKVIPEQFNLDQGSLGDESDIAADSQEDAISDRTNFYEDDEELDGDNIALPMKPLDPNPTHDHSR